MRIARARSDANQNALRSLCLLLLLAAFRLGAFASRLPVVVLLLLLRCGSCGRFCALLSLRLAFPSLFGSHLVCSHSLPRRIRSYTNRDVSSAPTRGRVQTKSLFCDEVAQPLDTHALCCAKRSLTKSAGKENGGKMKKKDQKALGLFRRILPASTLTANFVLAPLSTAHLLWSPTALWRL